MTDEVSGPKVIVPAPGDEKLRLVIYDDTDQHLFLQFVLENHARLHILEVINGSGCFHPMAELNEPNFDALFVFYRPLIESKSCDEAKKLTKLLLKLKMKYFSEEKHHFFILFSPSWTSDGSDLSQFFQIELGIIFGAKNDHETQEVLERAFTYSQRQKLFGDVRKSSPQALRVSTPSSSIIRAVQPNPRSGNSGSK